MSQAPKQTVLKPAPETEAEAPSVANDLSEAEIQLLHEGLAALREAGETEGIEDNERKSVRALIAYAACDLGGNEEVIRAQVERCFEVSDISELNGSHFDDLVRFLEKMDVKQLIN